MIIPVFENEKNNLKIFDEEIENLGFSGKFGESEWYFFEKQKKRIIFVGLGDKKDFSERKWRQAVGAGVTFLQGKKIVNQTLLLRKEISREMDLYQLLNQGVVAAMAASYVFDDFKSEKENKILPLESLCFFKEKEKGENLAKVKEVIETGEKIGEAVNYARHLGNTPPMIMTPGFLANEAVRLAKKDKVKTKIFSLSEIKKMKMGCLLAVAQGSVEEPKFIAVEYSGGKPKEAPTVLVGKGITFDSGGLSLKPADYMSDMKYDMLGAATVLATIRLAADLKLKKNIVALVPATENMPGGSAYRPDDIIVAMNGKSVEIKNTDAEGRLILADALCYAAKYNPKEVIDVATLTGACLVALGNERSGLFSSDEKLVEKILSASKAASEDLWRLPLGEEYEEANKSEVADIKNLGGVGSDPRFGGASTAASFLKFFTSYPWAHIDLSSGYQNGKNKPWRRAGANGFGILTLIEFFKR